MISKILIERLQKLCISRKVYVDIPSILMVEIQFILQQTEIFYFSPSLN